MIVNYPTFTLGRERGWRETESLVDPLKFLTTGTKVLGS
ncbi:hypothetical protein MC7420_7661 [Coleofasciculus chthonoplastes PCC 7420]|uniref:Uncharacterized protein n=1 Tax=Coleofasciculus chthonoplastes PCC 7420 TaxID=118168 RepID=B4VIJ1_9CYAN|nr:hypothetical protein MC7420_7661 [Coleofasciculus chthonoplastes PCC 7420]